MSSKRATCPTCKTGQLIQKPRPGLWIECDNPTCGVIPLQPTPPTRLVTRESDEAHFWAVYEWRHGKD